ncbi:P2Y purinoceptor 13-like [Alosa sapidissima]|uniref:P2Y purinoceptor 13-like n=1 Tax=Alosa sapidissima TaxID=34773 RepID=UPI001C081FA4|nr:P2Y purinoceptor 13-like [Alosa sapidissima]
MASPPLVNCGLNMNFFNLVMACLYFALFIPALVLNIVTVCISWKLKAKSAFIVYLKNLVVADLLMTLMIPLKVLSNLPGASNGLMVLDCHVSSLFYLCLHMSIILMGLISLDRFFKIVRPAGKLFGQSALFARVAVIIIWTLLLSVNTIPTMMFNNVQPTNNSQQPTNNTAEVCMSIKSEFGKRYHEVVTFECSVIFLVVSLVMGFCYTCISKRVIMSYRISRSTDVDGGRKIKARVFIVLAVFLICFAPYHITRLPYVHRQVENKITCQWASLKVAKSFTLWLATTNVCLDPLIYVLLCKAFREKLYQFKIFGQWPSTLAQVINEDADL